MDPQFLLLASLSDSGMAFGVPALVAVGSSWCLTGAILGRAPKDGLDTGMVQLGASAVSIAIGLLLSATLLPPAHVPVRVLAATLGTYALGGALNFGALQAMAIGMQKGPNGRVWGIMQSAQLFSFLGGVVFFGDRLTATRGCGMALLVTAIVLFAVAKGDGSSAAKAAPSSGPGWRFWAFLSLAICSVQQNLAAAPSHFAAAREVSSVLRTVATAAGASTPALATLVLGALRGGAGSANKIASLARGRLWVYALGMQAFGLIFAYTLFYPGMDALGRVGAGALCWPILVGSCIVSFTIYSAVALKEKLTALHVLAVASCLAGLFLLCRTPRADGSGFFGTPTGFYHVETIDSADWAIAPDGRATTILGIDHVRPAGWKDRDLGYDVYARFVETNYPSKEAWVDETLGRLRDWGFNTLANHCDEPLLRHRGLAHTITLYLGGTFGRAGGKDPDRWITPWSGPCTGLPNVFHPDFESEVRKAAARQCAPEKDDPWLLGWFLDNELKWWGPDTARKDLTLFDTVRALPPNHTARQALEAFAAGRPVDNALREDFLRLFAERYFSVLCSAIREADPNHMILGCRFAGPFAQVHPALWEITGRHCDIVSFNCYPWADIDRGVVLDSKGGRPIAERFGEIHGWCGRPLMVTEFAFPALDAGRPCLYGAGQRFPTQEGRAAATALFARTMLSLPYFAGYSYFMFLDQPASGISETFREDSNYGLVSESGVPYREITAAFRALHADLSAARSAPTPEAEASGSGAVAPSERERYLAAAREAGSVPGASAPGSVIFAREADGAWSLSNALVRLSGRLGSDRVADEIALRDPSCRDPSCSTPLAGLRPLGSLGALLQWRGPHGDVWTMVSPESIEEERGAEGATSLLVRSVAPDAAFALTVRLALAPGSDSLFAEIVSVENTGDEPLSFTGLFLAPYPADPDPTPVPVVPNLWGAPARAWWRLPGGRAWGALSHDAAAAFRFWIRKADGSLHPDARFSAGREAVSLAPGDAWSPATPMGARIGFRPADSAP